MAEGEAIDGGDEHAQQVDSRLIALREMLIKAGLIVDLQREDGGDWFIVCAAQRGPDGLYGNRIQLAFRDERLLISTLADWSYAVADGANLAQLCRDCVNSSESTMDRLADEIIERHGLEVETGAS